MLHAWNVQHGRYALQRHPVCSSCFFFTDFLTDILIVVGLTAQILDEGKARYLCYFLIVIQLTI